MEQINLFTCLFGVLIEIEDCMKTEVSERTTSTFGLYHNLSNNLIRNKEISEDQNKTVFTPILAYLSGSWVLTNPLENKL